MDELEKQFKYTITLPSSESICTCCSEAIGRVGMGITCEDWDEEQDEFINLQEIGSLQGILITSSLNSNPNIYPALDNESAELEAMGRFLTQLEDDDDRKLYDDCVNDLRGYLLITHFHVLPEFEGTGIEQSIIKSLITQLGCLVSGIVTHPLKEIRTDEGGCVRIEYDNSHEGTKYIQKIYKDLDFIPVAVLDDELNSNDPYWIHWTTLVTPKMDAVPTFPQFKMPKLEVDAQREQYNQHIDNMNKHGAESAGRLKKLRLELLERHPNIESSDAYQEMLRTEAELETPTSHLKSITSP